jgi:GR25 family glycosyltransferase involved in LPS biosynthesis
MAPPSVQVVVVCAPHAPQREERMRAQLADMKLPYAVHFLRGMTPTNNGGWVVSPPPPVKGCGIPSSPYVQCCMGSHVRAIEWFVRNTSRELLVVMEDDVSLALDFHARLTEVLRTWDAEEEVELLALGYLPPSDAFRSTARKAHGAVMWDLCEPLWGTQCYAMHRRTAEKLHVMLSAPTIVDVASRAALFDAAGLAVNRTKTLRAVADTMLDYFALQGAVVPPMAVEAPLTSAMSGADTNFPIWRDAKGRGVFVPCDYYGAPFSS